jgi:hypothetical protein
MPLLAKRQGFRVLSSRVCEPRPHDGCPLRSPPAGDVSPGTRTHPTRAPDAHRFSVRLQPILLLTHGLSAGGPAVLFSARQTSGQQLPAALQQQQPNHPEGGAALDALGGGVAGSAAATLPQSGSLGALANEVAGEGPSRVRAVRITMHHTLLAEALRCVSGWGEVGCGGWEVYREAQFMPDCFSLGRAGGELQAVAHRSVNNASRCLATPPG